jgi:hypothetical protein
MSNIHLLIDSHHGVYVPQLFAEHCAHQWDGIKPKDIQTLLSGPDTEWYWESWETVLNNAKHKTISGLTLHQDGDLWAIDYEKMTAEEKSNFGFED